jgi:1,4-dihydroxy-2-naphthoate octaprenyltransferase
LHQDLPSGFRKDRGMPRGFATSARELPRRDFPADVLLHPAGRLSFGKGLFRLADPKISLASFSSMFLGACAAARDGPLSPLWLAVTFIGIWAIETAKNASGEIYDWDSGTDRSVAPGNRTPFSGGKRVLVDGLLTRRQTRTIALVGYAAGILAGLSVATYREPRVLLFGVVGIGLAFFYHAPPLKLSYRGLGELAVAMAYGPLIGSGTYLVQRGDLPWRVPLLFVPLGIAIAAFLWINELPDEKADRGAGKRTLVVRLGRARAATAFGAVLLASALTLALLPLAGWPAAVWLGALGFLPATRGARDLRADPHDMRRVIRAQFDTLKAFALLALGAGIGLLVAP